MSDRIVITRAVPETTLALLRSALPDAEIVINQEERNLSSQELLAMTGESCSALLCTLADKLDQTVLEKLPDNLKAIATYAVGTNNIDLEAAAARGITVANTPEVLTRASAEVAIGLMLACARRFVDGDQLTRDGDFTGWAPLFHLGHDLYGSTIGVVGPGRIGGQVARSLHAGFECKILYSARSPKPELDEACAAKRCELDALLAESDFVTLHCPLTDETHHLMNAQRIALMKPSAYLINTARGPVIDEAALIDALERGVIAGAGLDVYEEEPAVPEALRKLKNAVLLPHIGSATYTTREEMGRMCAQAIIDVLAGRKPSNAVD